MEQGQPLGKQNLRGRWYVLMAATLWGTTGTAQALAPVGVSPIAVGAVRLIVGGLALLLFAMLRRSPWQRSEWPAGATLVAASSMAAYQLCFFAGVDRTGVAIGTVVAIGSAPILTGAMAGVLYGERPSRRWLAATSLAILGCALLITAGRRIEVDLVGIFLAFGAGVSYASYSLASKRVLVQQTPDSAMAVVFCLGALLLLPLLFTVDLQWLVQPRGLAVMLHLGLVATAIAYLLFARGLRMIPVAVAVPLSLAEPLTAGLLGIFLLGEQLTPAAAIGIGLLLSGLIMLTWGKSLQLMEDE